MAEQNTDQERTEQPTARRLQQARDEGKIARSVELSTATVLIAGTAVLGASGGHALATYATRVLRESARLLSSEPMGAETAIAVLRGFGTGFVLAMLPFLLGVGLAALLISAAQSRGVITWKPLQPKLDRLNPVAALKRMFGMEGAFNLLKSIAKFAVLGVVTWMVLAGSWIELGGLSNAGPVETSIVMRTLIVRLGLVVGVSFLGLSLVDYGFQAFRTKKSLRMTKEEVTREHKETEGDPQIKGRILALARARARSRMLQQVPKATVVITNPTHIAVALRYDLDVAGAPVVVAMGQRKLAERIKALAKKAGVPVVENKPVARAMLATCTVGKAIPPALYAAVAEILAFVYRQRGGFPLADRRQAS